QTLASGSLSGTASSSTAGRPAGSDRLPDEALLPRRMTSNCINASIESGWLSPDRKGSLHGVNFGAGEAGDRGGERFWRHPGRLSARALAFAEQLGRLGRLLWAGRLRAARAGPAPRPAEGPRGAGGPGGARRRKAVAG